MAEGIREKPVKEKNPHEKHRIRLKKRFAKEGMAGFEEHNILELLLFYGVPRKDTNPIAHEMMGRFGSLEAVLEASPQQLQEIPNIGENATVLFSLVRQLILRYGETLCNELTGKIFDYQMTGECLVRRFAACDTEEVHAIFYDKGMVYMGEALLHRGSANSASFTLRDLADALSRNRASYVALVHNHPDGTPIASADDLDVSHQARSFLAHMGVTLIEHFVVGKNTFTGTEHRV